MRLIDLIDTMPYPLSVVVEVVPFRSKNALYQFLHKHRDTFPKVYSRGRGYAERHFTVADMLKMREMKYNEAAGARFGHSPGRPRVRLNPRGARPRRQYHGLLDNIIGNATTR
jgi:hypothetical protein